MAINVHKSSSKRAWDRELLHVHDVHLGVASSPIPGFCILKPRSKVDPSLVMPVGRPQNPGLGDSKAVRVSYQYNTIETPISRKASYSPYMFVSQRHPTPYSKFLSPSKPCQVFVHC